MMVIGIDLGGTKVTGAIFDSNGETIKKTSLLLEGKTGTEVAQLVKDLIIDFLKYQERGPKHIRAIGICVPGIANIKEGTVWAPNIPGWEDYPLQAEIEELVSRHNIKVYMASDRTCYILGEKWNGQAKDCENAIFVAVGTGIGVGILIDGRIIHGHGDVVGAVGWMALQSPYEEDFEQCGCFETYASGIGIAKQAKKILRAKTPLYRDSSLRNKDIDSITSHDVFFAYMYNDPLAVHVLNKAIEMWGMAAANLVSLFNPEKVIWGGGIFGPAQQFIDKIYDEACRWAQPISIKQVTFEKSLLSGDAGLLGAGYLALSSLNEDRENGMNGNGRGKRYTKF